MTNKDSTIQQIEIEKREVCRKYEALEQQNYQLAERLAAAEIRVQVLEKDNAGLSQQVLNMQCTQQRSTLWPANRKSNEDLEADGIRLLDFDQQMTRLDQMEDLRMSIGVSSEEKRVR